MTDDREPQELLDHLAEDFTAYLDAKKAREDFVDNNRRPKIAGAYDDVRHYQRRIGALRAHDERLRELDHDISLLERRYRVTGQQVKRILSPPPNITVAMRLSDGRYIRLHNNSMHSTLHVEGIEDGPTEEDWDRARSELNDRELPFF